MIYFLILHNSLLDCAIDATIGQVDGESNETGPKDTARGKTTVHGFVVSENFAFVFGCSPNMGVIASTTMIKDVAEILTEKYSRDTFSIEFPDCLNDLKGNDASFEMVTSNTL